jgi:hypothetical protein
VAGSFRRGRGAGADRFSFTGRVGGYALRPGRYRLVATPTVAGRVGRTLHAGFRIAR